MDGFAGWGVLVWHVIRHQDGHICLFPTIRSSRAGVLWRIKVSAAGTEVLADYRLLNLAIPFIGHPRLVILGFRSLVRGLDRRPLFAARRSNSATSDGTRPGPEAQRKTLRCLGGTAPGAAR